MKLGFKDKGQALAVLNAFRDNIAPVFTWTPEPDENGLYYVEGSDELLQMLKLTAIAFPPFKTRNRLEERIRATIDEAIEDDAYAERQRKGNTPKVDHVYTYSEIQLLDLPDAPSLQVKIDGNWYPVQTSHVRDDEMVGRCPAFAESRWRYLTTTSEWVPIFHFVGELSDVEKIVDFVPSQLDHDTYWVTPKGSPRAEI